ncbi:uncharacterized protein LOC119302649 isoform X1 [Triticum dicoccoides]|uniref:uncharacterized protein LOC119302649 isoform X1 n=1 Tax=Triticum dicoccoides TaxID=85692 RepID=UPI0018907E1B|nr:uncharacterized protein LOC119302649 isoform X1 [Triticum dicoccoides]
MGLERSCLCLPVHVCYMLDQMGRVHIYFKIQSSRALNSSNMTSFQLLRTCGCDAVSASLSGSSSVELFHPSENLGSYVDDNHTCLVMLVRRLGQDVNDVIIVAAEYRVAWPKPRQDWLLLRVFVLAD